MTREVTCPRCRQVLHVAPDAREPWLTCPRCLADVNNPHGPPAEGAPRPSRASLDAEVRWGGYLAALAALLLTVLLMVGSIVLTGMGESALPTYSTDWRPAFLLSLPAQGAWLTGLIILVAALVSRRTRGAVVGTSCTVLLLAAAVLLSVVAFIVFA